MIAAVATLYSQLETGGVAVVVALVGFILHRKANHIEVKVNGQMTMLLTRVAQLELKMAAHGVPVPPPATPAEQLATAGIAAALGKINGPPEPPPPPPQD
jgi:hypothetical protein